MDGGRTREGSIRQKCSETNPTTVKESAERMHDPQTEVTYEMTYSNPEDKRQWEREHRQQRNEKRRKRRTQMAIIVTNPVPDPTAPTDPASTKYAIAIAIVLSVGLLLIAIAVWRKRRTCPRPVHDPKLPKVSSNDRNS